MVQTRHTRLAAAAAGEPPTPPQSLPKVRTKRLPRIPISRKEATQAAEQAAEAVDSEKSTSTSNPNATAHASSQPRALLHIWLDPTATVLASEKAPRAAPGVKIVVPLSAVKDFLNSFAKQPASNIDNTAMSPVTSMKRKNLGPAESSDSANKRARITAPSPQTDCNGTRQSTDDDIAAVTQASGPDTLIPSIEGPATASAGPAKPVNRLRFMHRAGPVRERAYELAGNNVHYPKQDVPAVLDSGKADMLFGSSMEPTSMMGKLNKHGREMAARRAKAAHDANIAAQQQLILTEDTSQHKDTTDATSTNREELTAQGMEEAASRQLHPTSGATVQIQTQTNPLGEPSQVVHTEPSLPNRRWLIGSIVDSVSRYVPVFSRAPPRTIQETPAGSNMPQTEITPADVTHPSVVQGTESSKVKKRSHKSVDQRKASSKRKKAQLSAERRQAQVMEAKKREMEDEVIRRVYRAMNARYEAEYLAEKAHNPKAKRKRYSPDVIPNPPGVSYGLDVEFFEVYSSDDEEPAPESPSLRPAKRVRLDLEATTTHVFRHDEIIGDRFRAQPYTGTMFADPPPKTLAKPTPALSKRPRKIYAKPPPPTPALPDLSETNANGDRVGPTLTFTVPYSDSDNDDEEESEASAPAPALTSIDKGKAKATDNSSPPQLPPLPPASSKPAARTFTMSERQAFLQAKSISFSDRRALLEWEWDRIYDGLKSSKEGSEMGPQELERWVVRKLECFDDKLPPMKEGPAPLPSKDQAESESLAKARQKATQYSPRRPSTLRSVSRISTSSIETPSDAGSTVKVYEPNQKVAAKSTEIIAKKSIISADGNVTKPVRGILKPSGGNALREVSGNMVPAKVNERQISAKESQVNHGNESRIDNATDNQVDNANDNQLGNATDNQLGNANDSQCIEMQVEMDVEPQFEQPPVETATAMNTVTSTNEVNLQFSAFGGGDVQFEPAIMQQLDNIWTGADADRVTQLGPTGLAQHLTMQHSSATN